MIALLPVPLVVQLLAHGRRAKLMQPFVYERDGFRVEVPAGFETDFNSVPRFLWWLFAPWEYPGAGVVHDWLYQHPGDLSRGDCDQVYRAILALEDCPARLRWEAYLGIRAGGWLPWRRYRKQGLR